MYWHKKYGLYTLRNARMGVTLDIINEGINNNKLGRPLWTLGDQRWFGGTHDYYYY